MKSLIQTLAGFALIALCWLPSPSLAGECVAGLCGVPNQSGGAGAAPCTFGNCAGGGSILVAMTDRGTTYQFADDFDGDGIEDEFDNCPYAANCEQLDTDSDTIGNACDNCPGDQNDDQSDLDGDQIGDACDPDIDADGVMNTQDNCPLMSNAAQADNDSDGVGDGCDTDDDNDGCADSVDLCRLIASANCTNSQPAGNCDDDEDGDGSPGSIDNCPSIANNTTLTLQGILFLPQQDRDGDGLGDFCDSDLDSDGVLNHKDNCAAVPNPSQIDLDGDGRGDNGSWAGGTGTCDPQECYVVPGQNSCLSPSSPLEVAMVAVGPRSGEALKVGDSIDLALLTNRLHLTHSWTARFEKVPSNSDASLQNARSSGSTIGTSPIVAGCLRQDEKGACLEFNHVRFVPDTAGTYVIQITAELPQGDPEGLGRDVAQTTVTTEIAGSDQSGCQALQASILQAALLGAFLLGWRRRRSN